MHFLAGWIALGCGLLNLLGRKGTAGHRALGLLFVLSMCLVAVPAASRLAAGVFDLLVASALSSAAVTIWAVLPFAGREPGWVERHAYRMQGAYVGLCAAAANEIASAGMARMAPGGASWPVEAGTTLLVALVGWWLLRQQRAEVRRVASDYPSNTARQRV